MQESTAPPTTTSQNPQVVRLGRRLVQKLAICLRTARLYEETNVTQLEASNDLIATVRTIHDLQGTAQLASVMGALTINDLRMKTDVAGHYTFKYLIDVYESRGLGAINFLPELTPEELLEFCRICHSAPEADEEEDPYGAIEEALERSSIQTVKITEAIPETTGSENESALKQGAKRKSIRTFFQAIKVARYILESTDPTKINFKKAKRVVQNMVDSMAEEESILLALSTIKNYDEYTFNHSANVAVYCIAFGNRIGLDRQVLSDLGMAGLFHDLGKTRVPKEILNKPSRLVGEEWEVMKNHSIFGAELLLQSRVLNDTAIRNILVSFEHHLNLDLGGYPQLRDRREPNLFSKIVSIADCFDALTTPRVYRSTCYTPQEALSIMMEGRGTLFEPTLLKLFVNTIGIHPIGTIVELGSGDVGVVFRTSQKPGEIDKPFVKIFADTSGRRVEERIVDLSRRDDSGAPIYQIVRTMDPSDYFDSIEEYLEVL